MNRKSIGYHTRSRIDNSIKFSGGSFGGQFDQSTIERLVKAHFTVEIKGSGQPVFIDRTGREVWLYVTIDPSTTEAGRAALSEYRSKLAETQTAEDGKLARINALIDSLSLDDLLNLLEGSS